MNGQRPVVSSVHGMVAAAHPLAAFAGARILRAGGNAFDAAVAVAAALGVVEPAASGLGGGGFFLLYIAKDDEYRFIDAREKAPGASTKTCIWTKTVSQCRGHRRTGRWQPGYLASLQAWRIWPRILVSCR